MKKTLAILLAVLILLSAAACAAKSGVSESPPRGEGGYADSDYGYDYAENSVGEAMPMAPIAPGYAPEPAADGKPGLGLISSHLLSSSSAMISEKIIYSANASIETTEYDASLQTLAELIKSYDAFIENSYESGYGVNDYYGGPEMGYRSASFTLRVPSARFADFIEKLSTIGSVRNQSSNAENVTEQYSDYESRLKTYRVEEERLLAMLEKADTVADMITIESTLSGVRYNIEYITSSLQNLGNRINYSSVYLSIQEVQKLTKVEPINLTYGQQIAEGLKNTFACIGAFFAGFFKYLIIALPVLIILAVVAVIVALIIKNRRTKKKKEEKNG
ncbi:MAG: DUF4349 domain-containing protein [Oscillospiraceae bacterium]|jgi:hypothetical protein|nr:DUF4349 domain-containing protein [Oscillospiraceae bacterium]